MPSMTIIATQLTDQSARAYTLTIGTFGDVLRQPGVTLYLVDLSTIHVDEQGPGGVSQMTFTIVDMNLSVVLAESDNVEFWDVTNNLPLFTGFIQNWSIVPAAVGRTIAVTCVGIEAVLDWMVVPSLTIPTSMDREAAVQSIVANATGIGVQLRALKGSGFGSQAGPIGTNSSGVVDPNGTTIVFAGDTVREALRQIAQAGGYGFTTWAFTVDFWHGVRWWTDTYPVPSSPPATAVPSDYAALTISDTIGGAIASTSLNHDTDATGVYRGVYIQGANAAATGFVSDGTGLPGPVAYLSDSSITTAAKRNAVGYAYLKDKATSQRGSLSIQAGIPTTNVRAGSQVTITDAPVGLSSSTYVITSIARSFLAPTRQTWTVAYGGLPPSAMRLVRRLTRIIRS